MPNLLLKLQKMLSVLGVRNSIDPYPALEPWRFHNLSPRSLFARASTIRFPAVRKTQPTSVIQFQENTGFRNARSSRPGTLGDFAGFTAYQAGDDPRIIDWRATARARTPMVRRWEGESLQPVVIVVDVSASLWFDGGDKTSFRPIDSALELASILAAGALARQMPVDLMLVSDRVELHLNRIQGRNGLDHLLKKLAGFEPSHRATNWTEAAESLSQIRQGAWLFWISDFLWLPEPEIMRHACGRFQSTGIFVPQPAPSLNDRNSVNYDIETGLPLKSHLKDDLSYRRERLNKWSRLSRLPILEIQPGEPQPETLIAEWLVGFHSSGGPR